jgi:hypothetical protein
VSTSPIKPARPRTFTLLAITLAGPGSSGVLRTSAAAFLAAALFAAVVLLVGDGVCASKLLVTITASKTEKYFFMA